MKGRIPRTYRFMVDQPAELGAGLRGFTDEIFVVVDSGDPTGDEGDFADFIRQALAEWYDGAAVTPSAEYYRYRVEEEEVFRDIHKEDDRTSWQQEETARLSEEAARLDGEEGDDDD